MILRSMSSMTMESIVVHRFHLRLRVHLWSGFPQTHRMLNSFLLGTVIGLLAVMTPGPVSMALVDLGAARGRSSGVQAGLGVAGGDLFAGTSALAVVGLGTALPSAFFTATQAFSSGALIIIGMGLLGRPDLGHDIVGRIKNPFRSMFAITALAPSVFGAWIALFTAMPFAHDLPRLAAFAGGGIMSSVGWHLVLGGAAGSVSSAITVARRTAFARIGGLAMLGVAAWTLA